MADLKSLHGTIKVNTIQGRYITNDDIFPFLETLEQQFIIENIGISVLGKPIKSVTFGTGKYKIFMWSQMHGNESTTTKATLDFINFISYESDLASMILKNCTIKIIPILNPDGAEVYTRVNANGVDLNRDAQDRLQPESKVLRDTYEKFQPDYCFNLHDQRTIFNVGLTPKPATISFLAPAYDEERSVSKTRGESMQLIVAMNQELQKYIPGQVGRYDDGFNANCVGDTFQMLNKSTILFEAGHFPEDYEREETRGFIFCALLKVGSVIAQQSIGNFEQKKYFEIPENGKLFYDILIKNAQVLNESLPKGASVGILFKEKLVSKKLRFISTIEKIDKFDSCFGHLIYNCLNSSDLKEIESNKELYNLLTKN